jgi:hypothetical protein
LQPADVGMGVREQVQLERRRVREERKHSSGHRDVSARRLPAPAVLRSRRPY